MAERVGFEPTWGFTPHPISSRRRYGHFGTSPRRWYTLIFPDAGGKSARRGAEKTIQDYKAAPSLRSLALMN